MQQDLLEACSHGFLDPIPRVSDSGEELGLLREGAKGDEGRHLLSRKEHQALLGLAEVFGVYCPWPTAYVDLLRSYWVISAAGETGFLCIDFQ